jgi:GTP-binding protein
MPARASDPLDEEIGRWLRVESTPVIVIANKAEEAQPQAASIEAFRLGLGDPVAISAEHGEGVADLFEALRPTSSGKTWRTDEDAEARR